MSDQIPKGPDETPPGRPPESQTDNRRAIIVELDGLGDTTIRPARSPVLRQIRPDQPPPPDKK